MWGVLFSAAKWVGRNAVGVFTGGTLDSILNTIDRGMDDEVEKEKVKADVTKKWIDAQAQLLVGRTWWFQLFFVLPAGLYWSSLAWVSAFPHLGWEVDRMPGFAEEVFLGIISALFLVDGGKALLGRVNK
jgi:hypothetical protein